MTTTTQFEIRRLFVVAPTRATCVNIEVAIKNAPEITTFLDRECGPEIEDMIDNLHLGGAGVVAGTGTGKTLMIRQIARRLLGDDVRVAVVTRDHQATEEMWRRNNVFVVTPGIALICLKRGCLSETDLFVLDEIHQTSAHLELVQALGKRGNHRFVWMSATIDPKVYAEYLNARTVIRCEAFDETHRAEAFSLSTEIGRFLEDRVDQFVWERRGVAVFLPTRAMCEQLAQKYAEYSDDLVVTFFHGGEQADKLRPFLTGEIKKPFIVFMTNAGSSSLNVQGLNTVVMVDKMYKEVVVGGTRVLKSGDLDANTMLQMGGRVNGRAINGQVFILSEFRDVDFHSLEPIAPEFVLGGDLRELALVSAACGVDARELDLIVEIDRDAYRREVLRFQRRGVIAGDYSLTDYGARVERLPVDSVWSELLVRANSDERYFENVSFMNALVVIACTDQLYNLVHTDSARRSYWNGTFGAVAGSDHLTAYNIVASALRDFGYITDEERPRYRLRGDVSFRKKGKRGAFGQWCFEHGLKGKAIKDVLSGLKSLFHAMGVSLQEPSSFVAVRAEDELHQMFVRLLAEVQSMDYIVGGKNPATNKDVYPSRFGLITQWSAYCGQIRHWVDKNQNPGASAEGTVIPADLVRSQAKWCAVDVICVVAKGEKFLVREEFLFCDAPLASGGSMFVPKMREVTVDCEDLPDYLQARVPRLLAEWLTSRMYQGIAA